MKENGNPINDQGSSYHFRSYITGREPAHGGLNIQVLQFADRLELINHTGKTVTVYGYEGEPYAQVLPDGTVRVNTPSPAYYLNQAFYANVTVPPYAPAPTAHPSGPSSTRRAGWNGTTTGSTGCRRWSRRRSRTRASGRRSSTGRCRSASAPRPGRHRGTLLGAGVGIQHAGRRDRGPGSADSAPVSCSLVREAPGRSTSGRARAGEGGPRPRGLVAHRRLRTGGLVGSSGVCLGEGFGSDDWVWGPRRTSRDPFVGVDMNVVGRPVMLYSLPTMPSASL